MIDIFKKNIFPTIQLSKINETIPENWHVSFIVHLASLLRPKLYLELGLYHCELFNQVEPYARKMIGLDTNQDSHKYMIDSPKVSFVCSNTHEYIKILKKTNPQIDLLFIDADHRYRSVKQDFEDYAPYVSDQGVILLHDGYPKNKKYTSSGYCGDGYKAIWELSQKKGLYEFVTIPIHPGLTICRKRKTQLNWD